MSDDTVIKLIQPGILTDRLSEVLRDGARELLIQAVEAEVSEFLAAIDGARESAHDWRALLLDLKCRGLSMVPKAAVANGVLGFWKGIGQIWPKTREQRCWVPRPAAGYPYLLRDVTIERA